VEQASSLFLSEDFILGRADCILGRADCILGRQIVFWGGRDAHPTKKFSDCGTGILPVLKRRLYFGAGETPTPQENLVIVEQASCLLLREDCILGRAYCILGRADCILGRARRPPHKKI
jgi:hypothetical protein